MNEATVDETIGLREALERIKSELGVPQPDYPAPVANAWYIADAALNGHRYAEGDEEHASAGESEGGQARWDPMSHEHIEGFHGHVHPHDQNVHSNMDGLVGRGEDTGSTVLKAPGVEPAIVGENPEPTS